MQALKTTGLFRINPNRLLVFSGALLAVGLIGTPAAARQRKPNAPPASAKLPGLKLDATHTVGPPFRSGRLAVFPVYTSTQENLGTFLTLVEAMRARQAEVRELSNSTVGVLQVINKGKKPIFILAGTVVKGGKQDRQIGVDTVVPGNQKVAVKAYCVEHGRWNASRGGKATHGKFTVIQTLATKNVRVAAQHKQNQSAVWANVAKMNRKAGKSAGTGTLLATLGAKDVQRKLKAIVAKAARHFDALPSKRKVVGFAYAIDNKVKSVRWFFGADIFKRFRAMLFRTAAVEVITTKGRATAKAKALHVQRFVASRLKARAVRTAEKAGAAETTYSAAGKGYRSVTHYRVRAQSPRARGRRSPKPAARRRALTVSFD